MKQNELESLNITKRQCTKAMVKRQYRQAPSGQIDYEIK
jgi:hypothetical protein